MSLLRVNQARGGHGHFWGGSLQSEEALTHQLEEE